VSELCPLAATPLPFQQDPLFEAMWTVISIEQTLRKGARYALNPHAQVDLQREADACNAVVKALRDTYAHTITLDEARTLDPHTAVNVEYKVTGEVRGPYYVGDILPKELWPQYGITVRWWVGYPTPEQRRNKPWEVRS